VIGPLLVGYIRDAQLAAGVERALVYDRTLYILAGLLVVGLISNALIRPVAAKWFMKEEDVAALQAKAAALSPGAGGSYGIGTGGLDAKSALAWVIVGIPILWGVWNTLNSAVAIFR
jgi:hypothetical protein